MAPTEIPYEKSAGESLTTDDLQKQPPVMVHVVAPATLPAGYTFEAQIGGDPEQTFTVEVPEGGVNEGDTFMAPLPDDMAAGPHIKAPTGQWKDGLFGCFSLGICHPHFCCSLWCTQIAMGQIMQRMHLTWLGEPGPIVSTRNTFKVVVALVIAYTVYSTALELAAVPSSSEGYVPPGISIARFIGSILFTIWAIYALCKTRENIRAKYSIPEERCAGCEDLCCSAFCSCCAVAQMLRHTGEYETYHSKCLSITGLEDGAPTCV